MHNTSNKIKLILISLISLFLLSSNIQADDFYCNSDNIDDYLEAEIIEFIDIKTVKGSDWNKNFFNAFRKLYSGEINDISERYKKKYFANINVQFNNKLEYEDICRLLKEFHGKCPVMIEYHSNNASGNIPLKSEYDVSLHRDLLDALDENFGQGKYKIQY